VDVLLPKTVVEEVGAWIEDVMVCGSIPLRGVWNFKIVRAVRDSERAYHFRLIRVLQPVGPGRIWQSAIVPLS
jgi:hypothetical protein